MQCFPPFSLSRTNFIINKFNISSILNKEKRAILFRNCNTTFRFNLLKINSSDYNFFSTDIYLLSLIPE